MAEDRIQINPELTAIAQTYRNKKCIADEVLPKVPVFTESFAYMDYNKADFLTVPETLIGEKGIPNEIEQQGKEETDKVEDHAIKEYISVAKQESLKNSSPNIDLKRRATNQVTDILLLRKEVILANIMANENNFGKNTETLSETDKINKDDVNPLKILEKASLKMMYKPNKMVCSRRVFSALKMNPYIVDAVGVAARKSGIATKEQIKDLLELDEILIGESYQNIAKKGKPIDIRHCWGDNINLLYVNPVADTDYELSFGYFASLEDITIEEYHDKDRGVKGADVVKGYYRGKYIITSTDCGYLLKDVLKN